MISGRQERQPGSITPHTCRTMDSMLAPRTSRLRS
jgi:hypothetical protein